MVILQYLVRIWSSKHFKGINVLWFDGDIDVVGGGEKAKIKCLEDIFFNIFLINCTKVVKPFHIFEMLTHLRSKLCWNAYYSHVNVLTSRSFLDEFFLILDAVIANIS